MPPTVSAEVWEPNGCTASRLMLSFFPKLCLAMQAVKPQDSAPAHQNPGGKHKSSATGVSPLVQAADSSDSAPPRPLPTR